MYALVGPATPEAKEILAIPEAKDISAPRPQASSVVNAPPLKATCMVSNNRQELSKAMTSAYNRTPRIDFGAMVKSEKKLWVYNASRVDHKFDHPMLGNVTIPANKTRKRYSLWTSFPEVVMGTNYNIDENLLYPHAIEGEYFVNDLINPDSCGRSTFVSGGKTYPSSSIGRDFSVRGVFWSYNNPPKVSEVNAAVKKLKAHYADLLERMEVVYACATISEGTILRYRKDHPDASLEEALRETRLAKIALEVTPECHAACEYFKVTTPWHPGYQQDLNNKVRP